MKSYLSRLTRLLPTLVSLAIWGLVPWSANGASATFEAVESWSVTLNYRDFADGFTGTKTFSGRQTGKLTIRDGSYSLVNKTGMQLGGLDPDLTTREISQSGGRYSISGGYVFGPAFGAHAYGILFLGAFIVKVPLVDGEVPAFEDFDTYSGYGEPSAIVGGGSMSGFSLTATVRSTLSLTASGGPTPPPPPGPFAMAAGNYAGLFGQASGEFEDSSGFVSVKVSANGAISGRLTTVPASAAFAGQFDANGRYTNLVRLGTNLVGVDLNLDRTGTSPLTGFLWAPEWTAELEAERAAFDAKSHPAAALANRYTVRIRGSRAFNQPRGDSIASLQVSTAGQALLKGTLADGTPFSQKAPLSASGRWPVYQRLSSRRGFIVGWLEVNPENGLVVYGTVHWSKPPNAKSPIYPDGFDFTTEVEGSVWNSSGADFLVENGAVGFTFSEGDLLTPLIRVATFSGRGLTLATGEKLQLKVARSTGQFSGTFEPAGLATKIRFKGALLPDQGYGVGFFLSTNASGLMSVQ